MSSILKPLLCHHGLDKFLLRTIGRAMMMMMMLSTFRLPHIIYQNTTSAKASRAMCRIESKPRMIVPIPLSFRSSKDLSRCVSPNA